MTRGKKRFADYAKTQLEFHLLLVIFFNDSFSIKLWNFFCYPQFEILYTHWFLIEDLIFLLVAEFLLYLHHFVWFLTPSLLRALVFCFEESEEENSIFLWQLKTHKTKSMLLERLFDEENAALNSVICSQ